MADATRELDKQTVALLLAGLGIAALVATLWLSLRTVHDFNGGDCGTVFESVEVDDEGTPLPEEPDSNCDYTRGQAAQLPIALGVMGAASVIAGVAVWGSAPRNPASVDHP